MVPLNMTKGGGGLQFNSDRAGLEIDKIDRIYRNFFTVNV